MAPTESARGTISLSASTARRAPITCYYYMPGLLKPGPSLEIIFNKKVYESLPTDQKLAVRTAAAAAAHQTLVNFTYHHTQSLAPLLHEHGVQLRHFGDGVVQAMAWHSAEATDELGRSDPLTARVAPA